MERTQRLKDNGVTIECCTKTDPEVKVKELTVDPDKKLSMQRHEQRAEHWFISEGEASCTD